ncbi:hypothetical protein BKA58DRAFT_465208 [Alternaria rosae]|uniref:uncharacterized protein n=1 Tax=Alternaria rosae TaxID=1187941 RepID=UPI001E8D1B50|nr:uncharacterized protein BKA58DRAFT_465208 [Alternaria rosae]KAH6883376.1 hypothetical protein BKA58DRAFT_465208 [Alternaria rosae]
MSQEYHQDNNSSDDSFDNLDIGSLDLQLLRKAQSQATMDNESALLSVYDGPVYFAQSGIQPYDIGNYQPNDLPLYAPEDGQQQYSFNEYNQPTLEQLSHQPFSGTLPLRYSFIETDSTTNAPQHAVDAHAPFNDSFGYMTPSPSAQSHAAALAPVQPNPYGLAFRNLAEAKDSMLNRYIEKDWVAPADDSTIPTTDEERAGYVAELLDAMKDTLSCPEKQDKFRFIDRLAPGAKQFHAEHMEKVCWQLVDTAVNLHVIGPKSFSIYDTTPLKTMWQSRFLTFGERMGHLCALLRLSKSRCFSLIKGENLETTVGAPAQRYSGTLLNNHQNENRQEYIQQGRTIVKEKKATTPPEDKASGTDGDEELDSSVAISLPSNEPEEEFYSNVAMSLQPSEPLPPADVGTSVFGDFQSNNIQAVFEYAGDNSGQYENNQNVNGNSYDYGLQPVFNHALLSPGMLSANMLSPSASYAPLLTPSLHGIYSRSTQPSPVTPTTSYMPHMMEGYPYTPYFHPMAIPRPNRVLKRSAEDAQLEAHLNGPFQRPCLEDRENPRYQKGNGF